ncbi:hybrid sensor histidine kinase/response regulator [Roseinatronobacter alkalisoli]|uniref:histidine kinase n=1 Tax=Roseinatronobacter alkalisoli TaxID=3028235 RepID=A0ABT5TEH3_9RHOB|nr:ATP-binding protein [Roseinatronobacter sp. HJB301]MDD7972303.1 ATP-binding protein [Roseinatronobacter sp. HJB301]
MNAKLPAPKRLSALLALTTIFALAITVGTLSWVAVRLASDFNAQARQDAFQRVEHGVESIVARLKANSIDYSNWTEHYHALQRQDIAWLDENVGAGVDGDGVAQLIILGGSPLDDPLHWLAADIRPPPAADFAQTFAFAQSLVADDDPATNDFPITAFRWIGDELWLLSVDIVMPHTSVPDAVLPSSHLVFGIAVPHQLSRHMADTLLLSDVRVQSVPDEARASYNLNVAGDNPAWIVWSLPDPGTRAIISAIPPIALALGLLLAVLGGGVFAVRRLATDLEGALVTAEAASKAKSEFLTNMSHEIRTPLNGVMGMADLLVDTRLDAAQQEMLETIRQSGKNLLSLINDILDLARVEAGKMKLVSRPFRLADVIEHAEALHRPIAQAKSVTLRTTYGAGYADYRLGDETRVLQILHNVLGNAVKFTETGHITLNVDAEDPGHVVFRITDTGIGMTEEQISRFFLAFEQAEAGTTRRFGGTGLGMSIVRYLVDAMQGDVTVASRLGLGTEIIIQLAVPLMFGGTARQPPEISPEDGDSILPGHLKSCHLLVAEDNATNRKILSLMLTKLGVQAVFAQNGAEAYQLWQNTDFDLILMDISMPVMDGFAALQNMQRYSATTGRPAPRAIAATANVMKEQMESYAKAGFIDVLPKPIQRVTLEKALLRQIKSVNTPTVATAGNHNADEDRRYCIPE